ncbi:DUF421 domain-containing protein [Lucifera butyrica]|uniref:DUF421 domain-containing protein n=1 Tax=Lucifera butyrica TaxID=1351585 RepID=UPI001403B53C|nr:DUF421 domain-containing protein [Lucifera butyrica]
MEILGILVFRAVASIGVLFLVHLAMGQRQIGELSPFDFAVSITIGTIAGAAIADQRIELGNALISLILVGGMQVLLNYGSLKSRRLHKKINFEPIILVEEGQVIKANLHKARLTVEMLLQLLREKDVFDITAVELAVLEPHGRLSVLKKAECSPLTPRQCRLTVPDNDVLVPVIMEGELQEKALVQLGFTPEQIEAFRHEYRDVLRNVFIAFMDKRHQLHIVKEEVQGTERFLH